MIMIDNIKTGDTITFYTCCNADRKPFKGVVTMHSGLGLVCNVDGFYYELRKMVDVNLVENNT